MKKPVDIAFHRRQFVRVTDLPARIVVEETSPGESLGLHISAEPYDVPVGGGEVLPFEPPAKVRKASK